MTNAAELEYKNLLKDCAMKYLVYALSQIRNL